MDSGDYILNWYRTNDELNDSLEIHLSRLAIATTLVNIARRRMELLEDETCNSIT